MKISDTPLSPCLSKVYFYFVGHMGSSFQICAASINRLGDPEGHVSAPWALLEGDIQRAFYRAGITGLCLRACQ